MYSMAAGDMDPEYVQMVAAYVDEKLRAIAESSPMMAKEKVAVLAAIRIADELHALREESEGKEEILRQQAHSCLALVEKALKETDPQGGTHQTDGQ
jgi:cell division protein ZapA (FtsZ GTPase activity inhibitor)